MWTNYHSHNKYCDGKGELSDFVASAKTQKVIGLGFSSHAPLPFPCEWCIKKEELPQYFQDIEQLKILHPELEILRSLEIDFIPGVISPFEYKDELDYLIGSIHFVDRFSDGTHWEIDGNHTLFLKGLKEIFNDDIRAAIVRYYELVREMIFASAPDIVGHLDKIKIQNQDGKLFNESDKWYKDEVLKTIKLIDQAELITEVNTRGLYQKKSASTYPSRWILEELHKRKMPVTLSSDAHHPEDLTNTFAETAKMLSDIGFKTVSMFTHGMCVQVPFAEKGVSI